jgi:post-segregation antitoxin (ccd killing protein)
MKKQVGKTKAECRDVLAPVRAAKASVSQASRGKRWLAENRSAIAAYGEDIAQRGVFSDGLRKF